MIRNLIVTSFLIAIPAAAQAPLTITSTSPLPNGARGKAYSYRFTASGGTQPYTWTSGPLPDTFSLSSNGALNGSPGINGAGTFSIQVTVTDSASHMTSGTFSLTIDPGFLITTASLANGSVGVPYSQMIQASGGTPPYTFTVSSSSLFGQPSPPPPGLTLASNGTLSGTPTQNGTYTFTVQVEDAASNINTATFTMTIGNPVIFTTASPLPSGVAGIPYSQTIFAAGGTPPYTYSVVGATPPGLSLSASGTLSGTPTTPGTVGVMVQVKDSLGISATKQYQVTFATAPSLLQTSTQALDFSAAVEGDIPPAQTITIVSTNQTAVNYSIAVDGGAPNLPAPSWLTVTPTHGVTPSRLTISVNQGNSQSANLSAGIHVSVAGDNTMAPIDIAVTFKVSGIAANLEVVPNILTFAARSQAPGQSTQTLAIRNSGGTGTVPFTIAAPASGSFITSITPMSTHTSLNAPALIQVRVDTTGLAVGHYRDVVHVAWFLGTTDIPVELFVSDQGSILDVGTKGVRFAARQGQGAFAVEGVNVINRGDPASTVHWTATLLSGQDWLSLPSPVGTATPGKPGILTLQPLASVASQPAGPKYALVQISDPASLNMLVYFTAVLDVSGASNTLAPSPSPGGVVFTATAGSAKTSQVVQVNASTAASAGFQAAALTADGGTWLSVSPTSSNVSTSAPGSLTISADPTGLAGGTYTGEVDVSMGSQVRAIKVTFIVTNVFVAQCMPSKLIVAPTGLPGNFSVPAAWPAILRVQVYDDCGNTVSNAAVTASFSSGDFPLTLTSDGPSGTAVYSATWAPSIPASQINITFRATAGNLQGSSVIIGDALQNNAPTLAAHGVLNNLNTQVGGALAPGTVAQVFGTGLATGPSLTNSIPLPTTYNGSQFLTGSQAAPLYYVSSGQLTVQIPAELSPNRQYSVVASVNGALTLPDTIDTAPVTPGVAAFPDGTLIVQHSDFSLVTPDKPAKRGEYLIMYLVGMGATNPAVASGHYPPAVEPLARAVVPPTVTVDNQPAQVIYGGMTPGSIGLFQINFQVPLNAALATPLKVVVMQGTVAANTTTITVAQ